MSPGCSSGIASPYSSMMEMVFCGGGDPRKEEGGLSWPSKGMTMFSATPNSVPPNAFRHLALGQPKDCNAFQAAVEQGSPVRLIQEYPSEDESAEVPKELR